MLEISIAATSCCQAKWKGLRYIAMLATLLRATCNTQAVWLASGRQSPDVVMMLLLQGEREALDNSKSAVQRDQAVLQEQRADLQRHVQQLEAREANVASAEASIDAVRQQLEQQQAELAAQAQRVRLGMLMAGFYIRCVRSCVVCHADLQDGKMIRSSASFTELYGSSKALLNLKCGLLCAAGFRLCCQAAG
jgi:hypothetical protein